jgi:hypothetical protein
MMQEPNQKVVSRATLTFHEDLMALLGSASCTGAGPTHSQRVNLVAKRYQDMCAALLAEVKWEPADWDLLLEHTAGLQFRGAETAMMLPAAVRRAGSKPANAAVQSGLTGLAYRLERLNDAQLLAVADALERRRADASGALAAPQQA